MSEGEPSRALSARKHAQYIAFLSEDEDESDAAEEADPPRAVFGALSKSPSLFWVPKIQEYIHGT